MAKTISKHLRLSKSQEKELVEGSIEPDKIPDKETRVGYTGKLYIANARHHNPDSGIVMKHIWNARLAFLNKNDDSCMKSLGRALHYIQDKCTIETSNDLSHEPLENKLYLESVPENAIEKGINIAVCSPHYAKNMIDSIKPKQKLNDIIYQAGMYSATIAKAVIGEKTPSNKLEKDYKLSKEKYFRKTIPISFIISIITIFVFDRIMQNLLITLIFGVLSGYIVQKLDFSYHYLKNEAKWFGLK